VHTERENPGYAYEKGAPALHWYGAPRMVNLALAADVNRGRRVSELCDYIIVFIITAWF